MTNSAPGTEIVYLNLAPGMIASTAILARVTKLINVERAAMMAWPEDFENSTCNRYVGILPEGTPMELLAAKRSKLRSNRPTGTW